MTCSQCGRHAGVATQSIRPWGVVTLCPTCVGVPPARELDPGVLRRGRYEGRRATIRRISAEDGRTARDELVLFAHVGLVQSMEVGGGALPTLGTYLDPEST